MTPDTGAFTDRSGVS